MPIGSAEEPDTQLWGTASKPFHVVSSGAKSRKSIGAEFGQWRTFLITNTVSNWSSTPGAVRLCNRSLRRKRLLIKVNSGGNVTVNNPVPTTPGFPASTTNVQNTNTYPVTVTITGATATAVTVNGQNVGTGNGTYLVPSGAAIAITYTVAGAWTWVNANGTTASVAQPTTDGVIVGTREFINNVQAVVSPYNAGLGAGFLGLNDNERWECQQELWAAFPPSNSGPVLVTVCDEMYASDPEEHDPR